MNKDSNNLDDVQFSLFNEPITNTKPTDGLMTLMKVRDLIIGYGYKEITERISNEQDEDLKRQLKRSSLPYVTFSGIFTERRNDALISPSGLICIHIDKVDQPEGMKKKILEALRPALMFTSVSRHGLKVVFLIDLATGHHLDYFKALRHYFTQEMQITIDIGCDVSRACFLCHDPEVFFCEDPVPIDDLFIESYVGEIEQSKEILDAKEIVGESKLYVFPASDLLFQKGKAWVDSSKTFQEGNRHTYIVELAGFLHRTGVKKANALSRLLEFVQDGFDFKEIDGIVNRIYSNTAFTSKAPLKQRYSSASYVSFPLKMLWGPPEQIRNKIDEILSKRWEIGTGEIPTSIKRDYLIDVRDGKLRPDLLLLLAAVRSIIGVNRNMSSTNNSFIYSRMMGDEPWRKYTRYYIDKLFAEAMRKNMLAKVSGGQGCRGYYVSIRYRPEKLSEKIIENIRISNEKKERTKKAGDDIAVAKKSFKEQKKKLEDPLKRYPFRKEEEQQRHRQLINNSSAP